MDRSLHSPLLGGKARSGFNPRTRQSSASSAISGRKSILGGNFKKGSTSGRFSVSGRSNQSLQVVARSECNVVECFGFPLPVLVNEALTFSERNTAVSINFSSHGWAWAVYGRRLLVWQYKESKYEATRSFDSMRTPQRRGTTAQCRELTLPHCDIGHKASLITVFTTECNQMASCLAVSPTGDIRYWPSIAHDGSSVDCTGILEGQEFDHLLEIQPHGYLLVTTTCNLVLVQLKLQNGRHTIQHKTVKPPSGFFGGIGKKFASIIIGMNTGQDKENKFVKITGSKATEGNWNIALLADRWVQRWNFSDNGSEQFVFEDTEIIRKIREEFQIKFWSGRENNEIVVWLLDMQEWDSKLYILTGAVNNAISPQMHYAIAAMTPEADYLQLVRFMPLKLNMFYCEGVDSECLDFKFILNRGTAYMYSERAIYPINLSSAPTNEVDMEKIEFQSQNDKILAAADFSNIPLFFTRGHGLVCISPADFDSSDFVNSSFSPDIFSPAQLSESLNQTVASSTIGFTGNLILHDLDPDEIYNGQKDGVNQLKAAFIYYLKRNTPMCNTILKDIMPPNDAIEEIDSTLDKIVVSIVEDLAEDIPAADPRWEAKTDRQKFSLGSSGSLQIITQLKEKNLALTHFIEFLHTVGIWEKLNAATYRGAVKATPQVLSDINEKIIAAIALKSIQSSHSKTIDEAIQLVVEDWNEHPSGSLVHQDIFYVKLTRFQDIFRAFAEIADNYIATHQQTVQVASLLCTINSVVLAMLSEIIQIRETKKQLYAFPSSKQNSFEFLPWTANSGKFGLRDTLIHLINTTLKHGARSTGEPEVRQKLYQQMVDLIDFVLDGRKSYLESVKDNEKYGVLLQQYESQRRDLIAPLVDDVQYELAAKLAEKYLDFQILVMICDITQNQERLDNYISIFKDYNFSQFAINWHLRQNKQGDLFERFKSNQAELSRFLGDHPSLAWVQLVFNGELGRAARILFTLAQDEVEFVARKKTMLSLAKLAILASDTEVSIHVAEINTELSLIEYQEQIPESLLASFGYDTDNQRVLKAEEIINLFISEENEAANEFDFRKALELLNYVEDPFEVRHKIWCAAILKDSWTDYDMNAALEKIQNMLFFKLIDVCYLMDGELEDFLSPMEDFLNSPELGDLPKMKSFLYLLKLGYEHISESYHKKDMDQD